MLFDENTPWWEHTTIIEETVSTNIIAKKEAKSGAPHGTVVAAKKQTGGYGKLDRKWHSPNGGLWFSIILRPKKNIEGLSLLFALWTIDFLESQTGLKMEIHWPNDIYLNGKKLGGILLEGHYTDPSDNFITVGIGLNINNKSEIIPEEANAISLCDIIGKKIRLDYLLEDLLMHLQFNFENAEKYGFSAFLENIVRLCSMVGEKVEITSGTKKYTANVSSIGQKGQLIFKDGTELWACDKIRIMQ